MFACIRRQIVSRALFRSQITPAKPASDYCLAMSTRLPESISRIEESTHQDFSAGAHMLSGQTVGQFLKMMVRLRQPKRVLEIGTFTGFSACCMGVALSEGSVLMSLERDKRMADAARKNIERVGLASDHVTVHHGNAIDLLQTLDEYFDVIFLDADKANYRNYYDLIFNRRLLHPTGLLIADNVLFRGQVAHPDQTEGGIVHPAAVQMREFNKHVAADPRTEQVILDVRDGLSLIQWSPSHAPSLTLERTDQWLSSGVA